MTPSSGSVHATSLGLGSAIVASLKRHRNVPIAFLARVLGRPEPEVKTYLDQLEALGVVERTGESVQLVKG